MYQYKRDFVDHSVQIYTLQDYELNYLLNVNANHYNFNGIHNNIRSINKNVDELR